MRRSALCQKSLAKSLIMATFADAAGEEATHHHGYKFWYASDEEIAEFNKEASKKRKRK